MNYEGSGMKRVRFGSSQFAELAKHLSLQSCALSIRASFARFWQIPTRQPGPIFKVLIRGLQCIFVHLKTELLLDKDGDAW